MSRGAASLKKPAVPRNTWSRVSLDLYCLAPNHHAPERTSPIAVSIETRTPSLRIALASQVSLSRLCWSCRRCIKAHFCSLGWPAWSTSPARACSRWLAGGTSAPLPSTFTDAATTPRGTCGRWWARSSSQQRRSSKPTRGSRSPTRRPGRYTTRRTSTRSTCS